MLKLSLTPQFPLPPSPRFNFQHTRVRAKKKAEGWVVASYHLYARRIASYLFLWGFSLSRGASAHAAFFPESPRGFGTPHGMNEAKTKRERERGRERERERERERDRRVAVSTRQETLARRETLCPVNGVTGLPWLRNPIEAVPTTAPRPLESPFILEKHYKKRRGTSHRQATRLPLASLDVCPCTPSLLRPWVTSFPLSPPL